MIPLNLFFHNCTIRKVGKLRLRAMRLQSLKTMTPQTLLQKEVRIHIFEELYSTQFENYWFHDPK